jgi:hypothetical protein
MEDKYAEAVAALRDTVAQYEGQQAQEVAARSADIFLDHMDFVGDTADRKLLAKALFLATTVLVMTRDNAEEDVTHLLAVADGDECEDEECHFEHDDDPDTSFLGGQIEGMDAMIAAMVGISLTLADTVTSDFDHFDWTTGHEPPP